ncbi:MAG: type II toxin-antitoxin system VapC family toxin [Planctomycetes bacterium]|nr:type II toxin-antitoxin system VapC family toxin [Planctomycetota bacterium]
MSFLLDTHVWICAQESPALIGPTARAVVETTAEPLYVSSVSTLEVARLVEGGRIELRGSLQKWVKAAIDSLECRSLPVDHQLAIKAYRLPGRLHKDPADRLLVATARVHDLVVVTADERILRYRAVRSLDARR